MLTFPQQTNQYNQIIHQSKQIDYELQFEKSNETELNQKNQVLQFEIDLDERIKELCDFSSGNDFQESEFDQFSGEDNFFSFEH
jgi:hypothetical protein